MRKIEKTNEKSNRALGYALLGVGAAALVGAATALAVKSRNDDRRFRKSLADALNEEFESAASNEGTPLRVIVVGPNDDEDCGCECCCDCECCCACDCECEDAHAPECDCDACKSECAPEGTTEAPEAEHIPECSCEECKATQPPVEECAPEIKLEKPVRKSKKQPE